MTAAAGVRLTAGAPKRRRGASARRRRCPLRKRVGAGAKVCSESSVWLRYSRATHQHGQRAFTSNRNPPRVRHRRHGRNRKAARTGPPQRARPHRQTGVGGADATKRAAQTSSVAEGHTAGKDVRGRTTRGERSAPHLLPDERSRHDGTPISRGRQPPSENVTNDPTCSSAYVAACLGVSRAQTPRAGTPRRCPGTRDAPRPRRATAPARGGGPEPGPDRPRKTGGVT